MPLLPSSPPGTIHTYHMSWWLFLIRTPWRSSTACCCNTCSLFAASHSHSRVHTPSPPPVRDLCRGTLFSDEHMREKAQGYIMLYEMLLGKGSIQGGGKLKVCAVVFVTFLAGSSAVLRGDKCWRLSCFDGGPAERACIAAHDGSSNRSRRIKGVSRNPRACASMNAICFLFYRQVQYCPLSCSAVSYLLREMFASMLQWRAQTTITKSPASSKWVDLHESAQ